MAPNDPGSAALFDVEVAAIRQTLPTHLSPIDAQTVLMRLLDAVIAHGTDAIGRQAAEVARLALTTLDGVKIHQSQPPPAPREQRRFGLGFLSWPGADESGPPAPVAAPPEVLVSMDRLLAAARDVLETADRLRAAAVPPPPEITVQPWAKDSALVELLQDLLTGARRQQPEYLHKRLDQLVGDLSLEHGIDVVEYDRTNRDWFDVTPSAIDEVRTLRPALVAKGELLRLGEAREPSTAGNEGAQR